MLMNNELKYLLTVANYHNLTKAAEKLYISVPTLSRFIKRKEKNLGHSIFKKTGNYFELSNSGRAYINFLEQVYSSWQKLTDDLANDFYETNLELKIGFQANLGRLIISDILPHLNKLLPNIKLYTIENRLSSMLPMLRNDELDVVIAFDQQNDLTDLETASLAKGEVVLAGPKLPPNIKAIKKEDFNYPWLDINEVRKLPLLDLRKNSYFNKIIRNYFLLHENELPDNRFTLTSISDLLLAAESGLGYAVTLDTIVKLNNCKNIKLYSFDDDKITNSLDIIFKPSTKNKFLINTLIDICKSDVNHKLPGL